jgi:hypothetical protein
MPNTPNSMVVLDQFEQQSLPPCFIDSEETR